jgi:hypothetical protein
VFVTIGATVVALSYAAGEATDRRGDARVLSLSLAFLGIGGFMAPHAIGTPMILVRNDLSDCKVDEFRRTTRSADVRAPLRSH